MRARGSSLRATEASSRRTVIWPPEAAFCTCVGGDAAAPAVGAMRAPTASAAATTELGDSLAHRARVGAGDRAGRNIDRDGRGVGDGAAAGRRTRQQRGTAAAQRDR